MKKNTMKNTILTVKRYKMYTFNSFIRAEENSQIGKLILKYKDILTGRKTFKSTDRFLSIKFHEVNSNSTVPPCFSMV